MRKIVFVAIAVAVGSIRPMAGQSTSAQHPQEYRHYEGPPVTLAALLQEAAERNPELMALRRQIDVLRQRPAQDRGLDPPMAEAQIWQWPINSINPLDTNMY